VIDDDGSDGNEASLTASTTLPLDVSLFVSVKLDDEPANDDLFLPDDCESTTLTVGVGTAWLLGSSADVGCEPESDVGILVVFLWRSRRLRRPRLDDVSLDPVTAELSLGPSLTLSINFLSAPINHVKLHQNSTSTAVFKLSATFLSLLWLSRSEVSQGQM